MYNKDKQLEFTFNTFGLWFRAAGEWVYQSTIEEKLTDSGKRALKKAGKLEYLETDGVFTWTFNSPKLAEHFLNMFRRHSRSNYDNVKVKEFIVAG